MTELDPNNLVSPPAWSLALGTGCRALVIAAALLFAISALAWYISPRKKSFERVGAWSFTLGCLSLFGTFLGLATLFVANRFEYEYVWGHADTKNAVPYRIAGIWSGQEGSFLLWAVCAAVFGVLAVRHTQNLRRWFSIVYALFLGALSNILAFESPFDLNKFEGTPFVPVEGMGLAPSLQNYWVTIHPPTIFLGFGSLTVLFALAIAALVRRDYDEWLPIVRPWAIISATLVGVGLCMGGFWAYETLGWGGFWMWDPVENVSFVPWCFVVALIHGIIVQSTRKTWKITNTLLASLPFLAFVYGTFLTRSGLLSEASVHSFAEMDRSALKLLVAVMGGSVLGFLGLWTVRAFQARRSAMHADEPGGVFRREVFYMMGALLLVLMGLATAIGMSVPLVMALMGQKPKVVEEALYHQVLPYIFIPLMVLMAITPFVSWRSMKPKEFWGRFYSIACIAIGLTGITLFLTVVTPARTLINLNPTITMTGGYKVKGLMFLLLLVGICYMVLVANTWRVIELVKRTKMGVMSFVSHIGIAVLMSGLIISRGFEQHDETVVMRDHPGRLLGYEVHYKGMTSDLSDRNNQVLFELRDPHKNGEVIFTASPGLYNVQQGDQMNSMVWPHIQRGILHDVYVSLGPPQDRASQDVNVPLGKSVKLGELTLTYEEMVREGEMGSKGTLFGAKIKVTGQGRDDTIIPKLEVGTGGDPIEHAVELDQNMQLVMTGMNAADRSITIRVQLNTPIYPVEIFHKPLVGLVWLGTAIMTIAGFLAAAYRRYRGPRPTDVSDSNEAKSEAPPLVKSM
jgi:cytochrome c-type biogenesis protein CcmF